jgi:hypothetical protein
MIFISAFCKIDMSQIDREGSASPKNPAIEILSEIKCENSSSNGGPRVTN